ncbi:MAG: DUF434 domain-containing protein [Ruminococcus sp.]|nr:DUF434 domain-containing protein [Ruminococcus sp.]
MSRRGYVPEDERDFSDKSLPLLRRALSDVHELLNREYPAKSAAVFVGNRYQLSERQRLAIVRAAAADEKIALRRSKQRTTADGRVQIDGFNIIITLECALSGTTLYRCMDGTVRDLAAMRGTYRILDCTYKAAELLFEKVKTVSMDRDMAVPTAGADIFLDVPVSNSGRLKSLLLETGAAMGVDVSCELVPNADKELKRRDNVVTTDAIILNECTSWLNFAAEIIDERLPNVRVIELNADIFGKAAPTKKNDGTVIGVRR